MKEVRVYELKVKHECVPLAETSIQARAIMQQPHPDAFIVSRGDEKSDVMVVEQRNIPIQEFCLPSKIAKDLGVDFRLGRGQYEKEYIAIDQELERTIFDAKWKPLLEREQEDHRDTKNSFSVYKDMVKGWWDMPWYKRVWSALKG